MRRFQRRAHIAGANEVAFQHVADLLDERHAGGARRTLERVHDAKDPAQVFAIARFALERGQVRTYLHELLFELLGEDRAQPHRE